MQRYKATFAYDGSSYSGFQIQPNGKTVQAEIERALQKMHKGQAISVTASGRTDTGVHARGQVIHFDSPLVLPSERWVKALNGLVPDDIAFYTVEAVSSQFHARFDATGKTYKYFLYNGTVRDPFKRHYAYHFQYPIQIEKMRRAAKELVGTFDYTSFCSAKTEVACKVRTVSEIKIDQMDGELVFSLTGNGFLYNMVRIIVGTLIDVGTGRIAVEAIPSIIAAKDRTVAGKTAPAHGLYLWEVFYDLDVVAPEKSG